MSRIWIFFDLAFQFRMRISKTNFLRTVICNSLTFANIDRWNSLSQWIIREHKAAKRPKTRIWMRFQYLMTNFSGNVRLEFHFNKSIRGRTEIYSKQTFGSQCRRFGVSGRRARVKNWIFMSALLEFMALEECIETIEINIGLWLKRKSCLRRKQKLIAVKSSSNKVLRPQSNWWQPLWSWLQQISGSWKIFSLRRCSAPLCPVFSFTFIGFLNKSEQIKPWLGLFSLKSDAEAADKAESAIGLNENSSLMVSTGSGTRKASQLGWKV